MGRHIIPFHVRRYFILEGEDPLEVVKDWSLSAIVSLSRLNTDLEHYQTALGYLYDSLLQHADREFFVAFSHDEERVLARATYALVKNVPMPHGLPYNVIVDKEFRGHGIGTALVRYVLDHCIKLPPAAPGLLSFISTVVPWEAPQARHFIEKFGFATTNQKPGELYHLPIVDQ